MKKNYILLVVALFIGFATTYAQGVRSTLSVNVVDSEPADSLGVAFYPYKLKIIQDFDVSRLKTDTLHLKLENTSFFQSLRAKGDPNFALIPNMSVCAKIKRGAYQNIDCSFNGVDIIIPNNKYLQIRVEYGYYSDLCFRTEIDVEACGLLQYDFGWNSWYFKVANEPIEFDEVCLVVPETAYCYIDCNSCVTRNGKIQLRLKQKRYKDISFYLADKKWYDSYTMEIGNVKCHLLLSKRDTVRNENVISVPMTHLSEDYITKRKEQTQQMIETLNRLFPESELREVTILEERLVAQGGKYGYGRTVRTSDSSAAVFVDKSFWESPSLAHELVHAYMNYNYEQIAARYFFDEALIEYFANYVYYSDSDERNKAFREKMDYFSNLPGDKTTSLFDINRNYVYTNSGDGTWGTIYYRAPYQIHLFVEKVGIERFMTALSTFNRLVKQGVKPEFEDFGKILQSFGVSEKDWILFSRSL